MASIMWIMTSALTISLISSLNFSSLSTFPLISFSGSKRPAVSIRTSSSAPPNGFFIVFGSFILPKALFIIPLVVPGVSDTSENFPPRSAFISVDLPTFSAPIIATFIIISPTSI
ncbi:114aa long hypothetical protein [Pyrococcus horikoshii OT3]|uniref:Uncharacterized protein n=1 Tax=Pyrococcus horikoshii (strain ATCC 700860 / DSM 12428 / JCM 9974 / NBRC 100139 / OT-3) TaxID=70601 RepID=O58083_PYRHO|nr:114aa long hypothetical protein [Pyrococcus horikoshii OT3]